MGQKKAIIAPGDQKKVKERLKACGTQQNNKPRTGFRRWRKASAGKEKKGG